MSGLFSVVIPVYRNAESLAELVAKLAEVQSQVRSRFGMSMETVFVVDGSPDDSHARLAAMLPTAPFASRLLLHSRNFGSFPAIRSGLAAASGECFGVIAADLQEPPELLLRFLESLAADTSDVVVGCREGRADPPASRLASGVFWMLYRRFVVPEMPAAGVDVFGCNRRFRDRLLALEEAHSSLIGQLFWLGFRRTEVKYHRLPRKHGRSAWSVRRKLRYLFDSVFAFTDLPIRLLALFGGVGVLASLVLGVVVLAAKLMGNVPVPGYAATALIVIFFGGINALGLGVVGSYAWRTYENTKRRPLAIVMSAQAFSGAMSDRQRPAGDRPPAAQVPGQASAQSATEIVGEGDGRRVRA